jgi:signal transduction histidine kinase
MDANDLPTRRRVSTRAYLLAIVAALVVPGLLFTSLLFYRYASSERTAYEQRAMTIAQQVMNAIDRDLAGMRTTLQTLSTSAWLAAGDYQGFHDQALAVKSFTGADLVLRDVDGQGRMDTRVARDSPLGRMSMAFDSVVLAQHQPVVSDVLAEPSGPYFALVITLPASGPARQFLDIRAPTTRILEIIRKDLPSQWVIGVADSHGNYLARSDKHETFSGKPGLPEFTNQLTGSGGTFTSSNPFGDEILVGYAASSVSEWKVAASIPRNAVEAPLRLDVALLVTFGAATLLASGGLVYWLWGQFATPLARLTAAGRLIGTPGARFDLCSSIEEIDSLEQAMASASQDLLERDAARAASEAALQESESRLRTANESLEARVEARTGDLLAMNEALRKEIEARAAAERQLRQVQKMEAIGQLSGGIAHDFNNMLAIILGGLNLAKSRLDRGDADVGRFIEAAIQGAQRAASLTNRLLAFARQQPLVPEPLDANELVLRMAELLHRALGEDIRLETILAPRLWQVHADAGQLENAVLNLAVNARDAMPDGGSLRIATANLHLDDGGSADHPGVACGDYVLVSVIDNGSGMAPDVVAKAFDPFFTTKEVGRGTGLGLSQVYGFVRQSGGTVRIQSQQGSGTTVCIYLPKHVSLETAMPADVAKSASPLGRPGETILVVEDEADVRRLTVETLRELNYAVREADRAVTALDLLTQDDSVTLLLTDVVMPDMNGRKLADEAGRRRPSLKILFMSGFTPDAIVNADMLEPGVNLLQKPFSMEQLAWKLRQLLDAD